MTDNERKETISALRQLLAMCDFVDQYGDFIDADPYFDAVEIAIDSLNKTAWIPVGERLPDENGLYLVTSNKWGEWEVFAEIFYDGEWVKTEPVAWMPLPEPYRGG